MENLTKKFTVLVTVLFLVGLFSGCSKNSNTTNSQNKESGATITQEYKWLQAKYDKIKEVNKELKTLWEEQDKYRGDKSFTGKNKFRELGMEAFSTDGQLDAMISEYNLNADEINRTKDVFNERCPLVIEKGELKEGEESNNKLIKTEQIIIDTPGVKDSSSNLSQLENIETITIGTQVWMKHNLNIGIKIAGNSEQANNGVIEKYCYDDDETNCDMYGGLYKWDETMRYSITPGARGICPSGTHIPTDAEWTTLVNYLGENPGTKMQFEGSSGFEALFTSARGVNGSFSGLGLGTSFWSSTESGTSAWYRNLGLRRTTVFRNTYSKMAGFSVRCLKD